MKEKIWYYDYVSLHGIINSKSGMGDIFVFDDILSFAENFNNIINYLVRLGMTISVQQISDELGFDNQSHFGTYYKRYMVFFPFIFIYKNHRYAAFSVIFCGIILMLWITIQFVIWSFNFMSTLYFIFGLLQAWTGYGYWKKYKQTTGGKKN